VTDADDRRSVLLTEQPGLRERKKQQTRRLLADTARKLFVDRGFDAVTVAEIARAADVSEPTVFNYFPRKEELVFSGLEGFEDELLTVISERPTGQSVFDAFAALVGEPGGSLISGDKNAAKRLLEISQVINGSPALLAREQQILARYTASLTDLIAGETRAGADDPRPAVTAAALIGVHRTLIDHVRRHLLAGDDLPGLARNTRRVAKKAFAHLEHELGTYAPKGQRLPRR
jgi:AcrR family transcriptional regulator